MDKKQVKRSKKPHVVDKRQQKLAEIIDMDADEIEKRLNNKKPFKSNLVRKVLINLSRKKK